MRIFISHSSEDKDLADRLVSLFRQALNLSSDDIRYTSSPGFGLTTGEPILEALRKDVKEAAVVIGLLTTNSLNSTWVTFELGARWGLGLRLFPLCAKGLKPGNLPEPLKSLTALDCADEAQLQRLLEDVAQKLAIDLDRGSSYSHLVVQCAGAARGSDISTKHKNDALGDNERNIALPGRNDGTSSGHSPSLVLNWGDLENRKILPSPFKMTSLVLDKPESIPQLPQQTHNLPLKNRKYFQELVEYVYDNAFLCPLGLRLENKSEVVAKRIRFVGNLAKTEGLYVRDEMDPVPEEDLFASMTPFPPNSIRNEEEGSLKLRELENRWEVTVDFGDTRPHDEVWTNCPLWFGATRAQILRLDGELRGDNLPTPIECFLDVWIGTADRPMNVDDLSPFLEDD